VGVRPTQLRGSLVSQLLGIAPPPGGPLRGYDRTWRPMRACWAHCAALKAAVTHLPRVSCETAWIRGEPHVTRRLAGSGGRAGADTGPTVNLEKFIASASIISASIEGHPVDA
jgi:hypothetical protein